MTEDEVMNQMVVAAGRMEGLTMARALSSAAVSMFQNAGTSERKILLFTTIIQTTIDDVTRRLGINAGSTKVVVTDRTALHESMKKQDLH